MEAEEDQRTRELTHMGRGYHGRPHSRHDSPPWSGHLPVLQEPSQSPSKKELAEVLSVLRLERAQERWDIMPALGEQEQFHLD